MKKLAAIANREGVELRLHEGGRHTRVQIGEHVTFVPRHSEINEITAQAILKQAEGRK